VAGELGTFIMNMHLIRHAGTGDDIAYLAAYLASDESSWVTARTSASTAAPPPDTGSDYRRGR
jgi:hypothetical protein